MSVDQVASVLLLMSDINENQARHAYSACLLLPGFESLRFSVLLRQAKRKWSASVPKYTEFWSAEIVLQKLLQSHLDWTSIKAVRNRLLLVLRLFHLFRSVDLHRTLRVLSLQGNATFILVKRKNQVKYQWEEVLQLPSARSCCPRTLLLHYVSLTAHLVPAGSFLFRALIPPFGPLSAKSLGSITKQLLSDLQVPVDIFGAHSTRGAAVCFYKKLGLSSDQVAQLGKWKNLEAFQKHYLRLGSVQVAENCLDGLVHNVSQGACAEPAWSRTPGADQAPGGSDHKGGAQEHCETLFLSPAFSCTILVGGAALTS